MDVRPITEDELPMLVDELWLPFAEEMAEIDPYHRLADVIRAKALEFRQGRLEDDDVRTLLAETDDSETDGDHTTAGYAVVVANDFRSESVLDVSRETNECGRVRCATRVFHSCTRRKHL